MRAVDNFHPAAFGDTVASLAAAFALGGLVGFERQFRQRNAGLRTNVLVAVGAAAFVDLAGSISGPDGVTRVVAYVVSGIGFLGAGVIMKEGAHVRGLNTAATLWCSAAVGACCGAGYLAQAAAVTAFVLAGNTLLRPIVNLINRLPINERETEALYRVHITCEPSDVAECRDLLFERLEAARYPIQSIETLSDTEDQVELAAILTASMADPGALDAITAKLEQSDVVLSATWTVSATN
jgi:putative Mg2+ transporter-C (MgtC) family protein